MKGVLFVIIKKGNNWKFKKLSWNIQSLSVYWDYQLARIMDRLNFSSGGYNYEICLQCVRLDLWRRGSRREVGRPARRLRLRAVRRGQGRLQPCWIRKLVPRSSCEFRGNFFCGLSFESVEYWMRHGIRWNAGDSLLLCCAQHKVWAASSCRSGTVHRTVSVDRFGFGMGGYFGCQRHPVTRWRFVAAVLRTA